MALKPIPYVRSPFASTATNDPFGQAVPGDPDTIPFATWDADVVRKAITPGRIGELAQHLGVKLTGKVRGKFVECHAVGREDVAPSATINGETGAYTDKAGDGATITIFDLAVKAGVYRTFPDAVNGLGKLLGAPPKLGTQGSAGRAREGQGGPAPPKADPPKAKEFKKQVWKTVEQAIRASKPGGATVGKRWAYPGGKFVVARYDFDGGKKTIRPFSVEPKTGLWTCGDPDGLLPLYLGDRLAPGVVLVTEGEGCADLAAGLGFAAVTSSHGSSSAAKTDWSPLAGRDVVILPDNDDQGARYARDVTAILRALDPPAKVRILELPDLPPKGDIAEWIEGRPELWTEDQVRAELRRLVEWAPEAPRAPESDADDPGKPEPPPKRLRMYGAAELAGLDLSITWLIKRILVAGENCVVGAPKKSLKTSIMLDLAVSAASGSPMLNTFAVGQRRKVLFLSGESGKRTTVKTLNRICESRSFTLADLDEYLFLCFELPRLTVGSDLAELAELIEESGAEIVVIDPLYLCMMAGPTVGGRQVEASNLFHVGPLLADVGRVCTDRGATPVIIHHFKQGDRKGKDAFEAPDLGDLAFAGIQEWARQWVLLNRRSRYIPGTGHHEVWLSTGGSAGHGGEWRVDVEEGTPDDDLNGRTWNPTVLEGSDAIRMEQEERAATGRAKETAREIEAMGKHRKHEEKLLDVLAKKGGPMPKGKLINVSGLSGANGQAAVDRLEVAGQVVVIDGPNKSKMVKLPDPNPDRD